MSSCIFQNTFNINVIAYINQEMKSEYIERYMWILHRCTRFSLLKHELVVFFSSLACFRTWLLRLALDPATILLVCFPPETLLPGRGSVKLFRALSEEPPDLCVLLADDEWFDNRVLDFSRDFLLGTLLTGVLNLTGSSFGGRSVASASRSCPAIRSSFHKVTLVSISSMVSFSGCSWGLSMMLNSINSSSSVLRFASFWALRFESSCLTKPASNLPRSAQAWSFDES